MKNLITLLFLLGSAMSFAQDWQTYYADANIEIQIAQITYEKPSHHRSHERIVFKYVNKTSDEVTINYDRALAYDGVDLASTPERHFTITLPANSELTYNTTENTSKTFYIFKKDNNGMIKRKLTAFDVTNLQYN